jgi:hypothetical protein
MADHKYHKTPCPPLKPRGEDRRTKERRTMAERRAGPKAKPKHPINKADPKELGVDDDQS